MAELHNRDADQTIAYNCCYYDKGKYSHLSDNLDGIFLAVAGFYVCHCCRFSEETGRQINSSATEKGNLFYLNFLCSASLHGEKISFIFLQFPCGSASPNTCSFKPVKINCLLLWKPERIDSISENESFMSASKLNLKKSENNKTKD